MLLIWNATIIAFTPLNKDKQHAMNQCVTTTPVPLPTSKGWMKTFGGDSSDAGRSVQQTSDGGYIVVAETYSFGAGQGDFWVIKTDGNGNKIWDKTFGGSNWDIPTDVKQTKDNGYIITGRTYSFGAGGIDIWVIKLDETGTVQWNKTYGTQYYEGGIESQQTSDGGYIIIGSKGLSQFRYYDAWLIKIDTNGNEQWNRTYGGPAEDYGHSVRQTHDGGYIVAGWTSSYGSYNNSTAAFWLFKTDEHGISQWNKTYEGNGFDVVSTVEPTSDGGYIIIGTKNISEPNMAGIWVIKTNQFGVEEWNKTYGGQLDDYGYEIYQTSTEEYIMIGTTTSFGAGAEDAWLIKIDVSGDEIWNKTYGGKYSDAGYSFNHTTDGGYIITGYTASYGNKNHNPDVWLIKTDSQGRSKTISSVQLWFERLFQRFPTAFPLLRYIMGD